MENQLAKIFSSYEGRSGELIPILQEAQAVFGYLPAEALVKIAEFTGVAESRVFGVASFYAQFRFTPIGKNRITVCRGTACHVRGGAMILDEVVKQLGINPGDTRADMEYTLESVGCIGACALAPTMVINDETYGRLTTRKVAEIFGSKNKEKENNENGNQ